jgi:transcriptional regulator with XRE-family HTH domain
MEIDTDLDLDERLGARLKAARLALGWTLDGLAERTGVSRAMISRVERAESSPTAALLVRLSTGLGVSLSSLFREEPAAGPIARRAEQTIWQDPASGYIRRNVSPPGTGSPTDIVDVTVPAGARIVFDETPALRRGDQQVWVFSGVLEITLGGVVHRLEAGDCMHMVLDGPIAFHNPGREPVHYAVALTLLDAAGQKAKP